MFTHHAYVGCRTTRERNARGEGIAVFGIDAAGRWQALGVHGTRPNPSFLVLAADGARLYAVHGDASEVSAFRIRPDGGLEEAGHATTAGLNPVDLALDPSGSFLVVTNHLSEGLSVRRLAGDGSFGELCAFAPVPGALGPHRIEQTRVKPHQARFDPTGTVLAVPNKGADTIATFRFDPASGDLSLLDPAAARLREGSGPRNLVFHPHLPVLFVVCELDNTVCVLRVEADGSLRPLQVVSSLPDDAFGFSRASAVVLSRDGGRLHVTNRGHDSVCSLSVEADGRLARPRWRGTGGRTPRFASLDHRGVGLVVANEDGDTIVALSPDDPDAAPVLLARTGSPTSILFRAC